MVSLNPESPGVWRLPQMVSKHHAIHQTVSGGHRWDADCQCVASEMETRPEELLGKLDGMWAATSSGCSEQEAAGAQCPEQCPGEPQKSLGEAGRGR